MRRPDFRALLEFCLALARRFREDRGVQTAGSLTFTTLLALVPLVTVALAMSTAFPVFDQAMDALGRYVSGQLLPEGGARITQQFSAFAAKAGGLTAIGLAFLAVTALMLILTVDEVLNRIFRVLRRRSLAQRLLMYWAVLTLGPLLIGASLSMTSFLVGSSLGMLDLGWLTRRVLGLMPFFFTCSALALLYLVVPYRRIEVRHALAGAIVAGVLFEFAKRAFALYIANFPTYSLIYGAFATLPIFLLWLYLSWVVVLFGATLTALLPGFRGGYRRQADAPGRELMDAVAVLRVLALARRDEGALALVKIARRAKLPPERCERVLERCAGQGWAARTDRENWLLVRDADTIALAAVVRAFTMDADVLRAEAPAALAEQLLRAEDSLTMTVHDLVQQEQGA
ncbi:MAG: YihY family inner membrane protein [Betaproteobacteria bacterium]|nr:YihY family inner membrane protein [Betaproteobacteria bacterium]